MLLYLLVCRYLTFPLRFGEPKNVQVDSQPGAKTRYRENINNMGEMNSGHSGCLRRISNNDKPSYVQHSGPR